MKSIVITGARWMLGLGLAAALAAGGGCWVFQPPSSGGDTIGAPSQVKQESGVVADPAMRVEITASQLKDFSNLVSQLPGADEATHRQLMERAFSALGQVLPNLMGPNPDAAFRQQIPLIVSAPGQLRALDPAASSESIIETGMRATYLALDDIRGHEFPDDADMASNLNNTMADSLEQLETSHDAAHRKLVADELTLAWQVMNSMNQTLTQRLSQSTTQPATQQATPPATQP